MQRVNKIAGSAVVRLAQQRRLRKGQEPDQGEMRIVDADSPAGGLRPLPVPLPAVNQVKSPAGGLHPLALPAGAFSAPQPEPVCSRCKDRGYLRANVPFGHPQFGKVVECTCKQAKRKEARRHVLRKQSKLDELVAFQQETFATFHLWLPGVQEAYEVALRFAEAPQGWLVLAGDHGCGKTHLAVAIARRCLERGATVLFAVVPDLLDRLRAAFAPAAEETYDEEFARMREAEVLILDDLGSEQSTGWATEKLFQLLNHRYNARLATVITTNRVGLEGIAPRLRSRLSDRRLVRTVILADAQDFRQLELGQ